MIDVFNRDRDPSQLSSLGTTYGATDCAVWLPRSLVSITYIDVANGRVDTEERRNLRPKSTFSHRAVLCRLNCTGSARGRRDRRTTEEETSQGGRSHGSNIARWPGGESGTYGERGPSNLNLLPVPRVAVDTGSVLAESGDRS